MTKRIAMWSGPRNISTAMMRSFENRRDCHVVDEPFYAFYLNETQSPHPMFDEILASQSGDYDIVAKSLSQSSNEFDQQHDSQRLVAPALQYQKHMTHHMLPNCDLSWTRSLTHSFLIRNPAHVVNSYTNSRGACSVDDIGIIRQYELYQAISEITQQDIPVVDSISVLSEPKRILRELCLSLDIDFDEKMLQWPTGQRKSDGVWASHWYHSVETSSSFAPPKEVQLSLSNAQMEVVEEVMPYYLKLKAKAL
jgi:hypothetical protein